MSRENVEIVRESVAAFNRGDLDDWLEFFDPEIEIDWSASRAPFSGTYTGHDGLRQIWPVLWDAWDEFSPQIEEVIDHEAERLITVNLVRARGKASGIEIAARGAVLWTLKRGKISHMKLYQGKDEALEGVGWRE